MKIAFIVAIYPPEREPSAVMAKEIAEHLTSLGHDVTIICPFPNRPKGQIFEGFKRSLKRAFDEDGVRVIRVGTWLLGPERKLLDRVLEGVTFGVASSIVLLLDRRCDVLLLESWPIFGQLPAALAAKAFGIPAVNYIKDIFPDAAVAAGILEKDSLLGRVFERVDSFICNSCVQNVVISEGMEDIFVKKRGLAQDKFTICWDWLDLSSMKPVDAGSKWREEVGLEAEHFVCMYAGTFGLASGVEVLLDVAERVRERERVRVVCIGDGVLREKLAAEKEKRGLDNFLVLPFQPRERVPEVQSSADAMILTSSPEMGLSSIPSKFITYLAMGNPAICSVAEASDIGRTVTGQEIGRVVTPGDADELAAAILDLEQIDVKELTAMGERARHVALSRYSIESALESITSILESAARRR